MLSRFYVRIQADFFSALEYAFLHNKLENTENFKYILFAIKRVHKQ